LKLAYLAKALSIFELKLKESRIKNFQSPFDSATPRKLGIEPLSFDAEVKDVVWIPS
jgi:hypothetical protein